MHGKGKFMLLLALIGFAFVTLIGCRGGGTDVTHVGRFNNLEQEEATDLHVEFDVEGVEVTHTGAKGEFPSSETHKDNKKQINLWGGNVPGGLTKGSAKQTFKRKAGDFKVEQWYWTTRNPETREHKRMGDIRKGPPNKGDGSGDWQ